jgi:hypothetical protein
MAHSRPTQRDLAAARNADRRAAMDLAIAEGRLVVRTMTAEERDQADARWAAAQARRRAGTKPRIGTNQAPIRPR